MFIVKFRNNLHEFCKLQNIFHENNGYIVAQGYRNKKNETCLYVAIYKSYIFREKFGNCGEICKHRWPFELLLELVPLSNVIFALKLPNSFGPSLFSFHSLWVLFWRNHVPPLPPIAAQGRKDVAKCKCLETMLSARRPMAVTGDFTFICTCFSSSSINWMDRFVFPFVLSRSINVNWSFVPVSTGPLLDYFWG